MWNDIRFACRLLIRERWFALAAITALALGIAVNTTIFTIVNAAMLRELPIADVDRMLVLKTDNPSNPRLRFEALSYVELRHWQNTARTFDGIAGHLEREMNVADDAAPPARVQAAYVSANTFGLIGEQPIAGREFRREDDQPGSEPVVLLGHGVWTSRYGANPAVIGRTIRVDGAAATVIGVMRRGFGFPQVAELWRPLGQLPEALRTDGAVREIVGVGRMKPGVTIEQARGDLDAVAAAFAAQHPDSNRGVISRVVSFRDETLSTQGRTVMRTLMLAVGFVLLIACANVANLMLARALGRAREMSLRMSIGASRWRIVRQLLAESLLLAVAAGALGLWLSIAGVRAFAGSLESQGAPYWLDLSIDGTVFVFVAVICLATVIVCGLVPALHAARTSITSIVNDAGRGHSPGMRSRRWTGGFVVVQLALTLVLLTGAALSVHDLVGQVRTDIGIETTGITIARIGLPPEVYASREDRAAFYRQLGERVAAIPGIRATFASAWPRGGGVSPEVTIAGRPDPGEGRRPRATYTTIGSGYFATLTTGTLRGRDFTLADGGDVAIVNERFAAMHFSGEDALGRQIRIGDNPDAPASAWLTIVGVAPNVLQRFSDDNPGFDPIVYVPYAASPLAFTTILARSAAGTAVVAAALRAELREIDRDLPLSRVSSLDAELARDRWEVGFLSVAFGLFAGIALVLATLGLYAVTAYAVSQRTREIGIRVALGAHARQVWWLVTRRVSLQLVIGLTIGMPGALGLGQILQGGFETVTATDPLTYIGVPLLLAAIALLACLIPARRAMRVNPVEALRAE